MNVDVDVLVARFRQTYGHTNFLDEHFTSDEYAYKLERGREMRAWLGREALHQLVDQQNWAEVCQRIPKSFAFSSGPLARWDEYQWVRDLDPQEQKQFVLALEDFLYGESEFRARLGQFITEATDVYLTFRDRDPRHQKSYRAKKLAWPFVTYFHFLMWPNQEEYVFVKPAYLWQSAEAANFDLHYSSMPNPETYASVQEFYRALWPTVQSLGGRDWIDVQTLIHVAGGGFGTPEGGWIDERQDDMWTERIAQWQAEHLPPERIAARRETEQEARILLENELGRFDDGIAARFLELLNADSVNSQANYTRFGQAFRGANRKLIIDHLESLNNWLVRLWQEPDSGVYDLLDEFWQAKDLPGAGRSLPTMVLYLRQPTRYNIWLPTLKCGLEHLTRSTTPWERSGAAYRHYNDAVNQICKHYSLQPQEVDVILTLACGLQGIDKPTPRPPFPSLASILTHVGDSPYVFSDEVITNYHLSLLTKPLVILTGLSGTGKTKLTRLYADAVHRIQADEDNPYYTIVAVRPDWTDSRGLLGYYNPLTHAYEATPFLRTMLRAAADPEHWYYVCLDEMNLARVEYYFSDFLSAMESGEPINLHGQEDCVATQAGEDVPSHLPIAEVQPWGYKVNDVLYVPPDLYIPPNLALSGTVNVDETTHVFSDKVLDRANSIEFSRTDLDCFAQRYCERFPDRIDLIDQVMPLLRQVYDLLERRYLHFGYRTLEEVLGYLWQNETLPDDVRRPRIEVLDNQLMQKVLPKLRGDERVQETLEELHNVLTGELGGQSHSAAKLKWMLDELKAFGSTHYWR